MVVSVVEIALYLRLVFAAFVLSIFNICSFVVSL